MEPGPQGHPLAPSLRPVPSSGDVIAQSHTPSRLGFLGGERQALCSAVEMKVNLQGSKKGSF